MAHIEQRQFCEKVKEKYPEYFKNKKVLDIGSLDINGSNKTLFENCDYTGLDVGEGKNVDVISVGHLYDAPDNTFDTIISTEVFEHDMFYEQTIWNVIRMLKPGGLFLFTCASTGRPEHGTRRTGGFDAPLLIQISEEWADYYKNLTEKDFRSIKGFNEAFSNSYFEHKTTDIEIPSDLYFYGIKDSLGKYPDDIFVIDYWVDTPVKRESLRRLIRRLKSFGIPILLTGHHPIELDIQQMVEYFLYTDDNPLLTHNEFLKNKVYSTRWTQMGDVRIENDRKFHHDYAIWETMRHAFYFCQELGKKHIHFLEYDNLPDLTQYRQAFLEYIPNSDAVIYEYHKGSSTLDNPYCATYIFSIKTDIAVKLVDSIKTKEEFFKNKPDAWQLEKNFLQGLKKITNNIHVTKYIPNDNEFNMQEVWNENGQIGPFVQFHLAVDENDDLYVHPMSGTGEKDATNDYMLEFVYEDFKKFQILPKGKYDLLCVGKYHLGSTLYVYHQGIEIFRKTLIEDVNTFRKYNRIFNTTVIEEASHQPDEVNINFIDGAFVEIKDVNEKKYNVKFIDTDSGDVVYELDLLSNHWAKPNKKYQVNWKIVITGIDNDFYYQHQYNPVDKRVLISFESKAIGDTLAWIPQIEQYRYENNCQVICSTFHNNLFKELYPKIEFVSPGATVDNIYALFRIGVFKDHDGKIDETKHPYNPLKLPLGQICTDILGMRYVERRPELPQFTQVKKNVVSIATHGTAQCKYWNNPNGWQEVVDYLVSEGYEVKLLSREENGYMGNVDPKNVSKVPSGSLENIIKIIQESELFIGISSGLSWISWAVGTETILISGFTEPETEPTHGIRRIINKDVCHGCWNNFIFDPGDWNWCPVHKGTERQFECSKSISSEMVISEIKRALDK